MRAQTHFALWGTHNEVSNHLARGDQFISRFTMGYSQKPALCHCIVSQSGETLRYCITPLAGTLITSLPWTGWLSTGSHWLY